MDAGRTILTPDSSCHTAIFGGSFDPPHQGHAELIRAVLVSDQFRLIVLAVTAQNPFKTRQATAHPLRLYMLRLLLKAEGFELTEEPRGKGVFLCPLPYQYTFEFVDYWRDNFEKNIAWVIGEDLKDEVFTWKDWTRMKLPLLILPEIEGFRSTQVRTGQLQPHPAIRQFIQEHSLYR